MSENRSLHVELRAGQSVTLDNGRIVVQLEAKTGKVAQLKITAPSDVSIQRPGVPANSGAAQARLGIERSTFQRN